MKSFADDLVTICDEIVDKPETTSNNLNGKTNNWLIYKESRICYCWWSSLLSIV